MDDELRYLTSLLKQQLRGAYLITAPNDDPYSISARNFVRDMVVCEYSGAVHRTVAHSVRQYAADGDDLAALSSMAIRGVFGDSEFDELKRRVRSELLPRLDDVRRNVELNHPSSDTPEEHMSSLMESLDTLKKVFGDDQEAVDIIDRETRYANEWIGENTPEEPKRKPRKLGKVETLITVRTNPQHPLQN